MKENTVLQTFIGFSIGLGIGAALGILFAPKSGEETRGYLVKGARGVIDDAVTTGRTFTRRTRQAANDAAARVMNAAEAGEQAYAKAKSA
jgi:gas vesicle protein